MTKHRAHPLLALALIVCAFVALHPYLDAEGYCGLGGCPDASHSSHAPHSGGSSTACVAAVLVAILAGP